MVSKGLGLDSRADGSMGCSASSWNEVKEIQLNEKLTERQIQVIKDTWALIADDMEGTGLLIFNRLFQTDTEVKSLFIRLTADANQKANFEDDLTIDEYMLKKHAHVVMEALGAAVECLEDSVFLSNVLVALGQIHAAYHVKPHYLPRLWPAVRYGLKEVLQDVFTEEVEETWKLVFNYIISKMKDGIRKEPKPTEGSTEDIL